MCPSYKSRLGASRLTCPEVTGQPLKRLAAFRAGVAVLPFLDL